MPRFEHKSDLMPSVRCGCTDLCWDVTGGGGVEWKFCEICIDSVALATSFPFLLKLQEPLFMLELVYIYIMISGPMYTFFNDPYFWLIVLKGLLINHPLRTTIFHCWACVNARRHRVMWDSMSQRRKWKRCFSRFRDVRGTRVPPLGRWKDEVSLMVIHLMVNQVELRDGGFRPFNCQRCTWNRQMNDMEVVKLVFV